MERIMGVLPAPIVSNQYRYSTDFKYLVFDTIDDTWWAWYYIESEKTEITPTQFLELWSEWEKNN